jgi:hypothetical protein
MSGSVTSGSVTSSQGIASTSNSDNASARWAALDSQLERLASAADRILVDRTDKDRDPELKVAS